MRNLFWAISALKKHLQPLQPIPKYGAFFYTIMLTITTALVHTDSLAEPFAEPLPQRINFQHLLDNKDIALGEVQAFLQDNQGFMWIGGGGGLVRYDGYEFKFILQTVQKSSGPEKKPVKNVFDIIEDNEHILWISTRTGLLRYDPKTELLIPTPDDPSAGKNLSTTPLWGATVIPSGELLISSSIGLFILDRKTYKYSVIVPDSTRKDWLHASLVKKSYIDKTGTLWLGTSAGLEKLDWPTQKFTLFKPYPEKPDAADPNAVTDIIADPDGTLWLGTLNGLVNFNTTTLTSTRYGDTQDPYSFTGKEIAKLLIDSKGTLWVTSDGGGITLFEKSDQFPKGHFINHTWDPGRSGTVISNQVRTVFEDRGGDIWVGTYPFGINYFDRSSGGIISYAHDASDPHSLSQSAILAVREDVKHNLWIGTDGGGLNYLDREKNQITVYKNEPGNDKSLSGNSVLDVFVADDGKVWCGTWGGGISVLDPATGEFYRMPFDSSQKHTASILTSKLLDHATVWSIKEDRQKNLWIGTHGGGGLNKFDRKTQTFTLYVHIANDPTSITFGTVWNTLEDSQGNFWLGTESGLDLMDRDKGTFTHFKTDPTNPNSLSNPSVTALFEDSKHRLWFGTEAGLNLLNPDGKTFTIYTKNIGFNDDNIRTIVEDNQGQLWLATNNGISVFNPDTQKVKNYNRDSGRLMGGFHTDSGLMSNNGEIIFGGVEGLRIFDPKKMKDNKVVPPIVFTGLKIFADTVNVGDSDRLLSQSLNLTSTLVLDYKKSMFQFSFAALNFRDSTKNNYAYMLEGFDKDWLQVGDQRSAKYTNLNPGTYVFRIKGSNNDGTWNETGKSITIVQLPPPWKTWWAYTLYTIIIISVVILFIYSQRKKRRLIEEQNRLLEIKVFERTAELREKNNDIQAMLSNMRQGLFTIEANGNVHPEYSRFLEEIFETTQISGSNALELLFGKAQLGSDTFDQIEQSINSIIGENEMNFSFNSHLLIDEFEANFSGKSKFLSLDWNPVLANHVVAKLMVSVRDVTQLKKMESEALNKKRELDIIGQLLNIPAKKYLSFATSAKKFIAENRVQIERNEQPGEAIIALLFRNMHTIKGNCRTFNLTYLSNVVHEVESVYSALKTDVKTHWNRETLLTDLERVETTLQEYERVYYTVLGRGDSSSATRDQEGFWADRKAIDTIQRCIDSSNQQFPALNQSKNLLPIQTLLNRALSNPMSEVLADVVASLPSIAIQLDKEVPQVIIDDNHVRIKSSATELMTNIFAHILRNSVDHGIETAAVRLQKGKPDKGTINIRALPQQHSLHILIHDDGQGINIDRLFKKGVEAGNWKAEDKPNYNDIANLIFASGISTKEEVTDISGRGVGMDAVKEFLLAQEGNISLALLGPYAEGNSINQGVMVPFELIVELPQSMFMVIV